MSQSQDFCDKYSPDENIYINEADGLTNQHPMLPPHDFDDDDDDLNDNDSENSRRQSMNKQHSTDSDSLDDLPTSLIVTNIHSDVFVNDELKDELEKLFQFFSPTVKFQWFRSFKRLRVNFDNAVAAANARIQLHQYQCGKSVITCYFAQPVTPVANKYLQPPAPFKQFLISPPASPPAGWEPREEGEPLVNHDLLAALANLTPGESHELHPQSTEHPGIIIHTAIVTQKDVNNANATNDDDNGDGIIDDSRDVEDQKASSRPAIMQTKCPDRS